MQRGQTLRSDGEYTRASSGGLKMVAAKDVPPPVGEENEAGSVPAGSSFTGKASHLDAVIAAAAPQLTLAFMLRLFAEDVRGVPVPLSLYRRA